jgi:hypothetical protein
VRSAESAILKEKTVIRRLLLNFVERKLQQVFLSVAAQAKYNKKVIPDQNYNPLICNDYLL